MRFRTSSALLVAYAAMAWSGIQLHAQQLYNIQLKNGMRFGPGVLSDTDSLSTNAFQRGGGGETSGKSIGLLDDGLRFTYFNLAPINIQGREVSTAPALEQFELPSSPESVRSGDPPPISGIRYMTAFNKYGRRTVGFSTLRGPVDVLQGITLLTPVYAELEILRWQQDKFAFDSRIATSSIPAQSLREILLQAIDLNNSSDWLRVVTFYMQAERFNEARSLLEEALERFPLELADRRAVLDQLNQRLANQMFDEIKRRRASGQHAFATTLLGKFPPQILPLETQVKLGDEIKAIQQQVLLTTEITTELRKYVAVLPEPDQQVIASLVEEILRELSLETLVRMADFQRLRFDDDLPNENKVALALAGWMLGTGVGLDNFATVKSLLRVRGMVREYLNDAPEPRRQQILSQLHSEEGATPPLLDQLLENMKPPQPLPSADSAEVPGLLALAVTTDAGETVDYLAQLPPEYDPNRKYPCVLALPGKNDAPAMEIDWWCGVQVTLPGGTEARMGHATRYGYIVVSPNWMAPTQPEYQYTEGEHSRILHCLRDAYRKFSIDTDRVFVGGHMDGATAAWDLALSHPDLWAGAIMISPGADKYIVQYSGNIQGKTPNEIPLGTYIVYGEFDGTRATSQLGSVATRYLESSRWDSMAVEYHGRGRERFIAELPRIIEWMELSSHTRKRHPRNIETKTMRPGDRFFYWLEAPMLLPNVAGNPFQFDPTSSGIFDARLLDADSNGVLISKIPSPKKSAIVWLDPEMVDFSRRITVNRKNFDLSPDIGVMLEDVRRRGDRQHVFWQRVLIE